MAEGHASRPPAPDGAVDNDGPLPIVEPSAGNDYNNFYTYEEEAALDTALWAGNMTRDDMHFKKDYAKGYQCLPVVRRMMADPLLIGPQEDNFSSPFLSYGFAPSDVLPGMLDYLPAAAAGATGWTDIEAPLVTQVQAGLYSLPQPQFASFLQELSAAMSPAALAAPEAARSEEFRQWLPTAMAWHAVDSTDTSAGSEAEEHPSDENYKTASAIDVSSGLAVQAALERLRFSLSSGTYSALFPADMPLIIDTTMGRVCLGTSKDDSYSGDFAVLIDPGGNDHYVNCRIGAAYGRRTHASRLGPDGEPTGASADYSPLGDGRVAFFCDLGGNDVYDCTDVDITLGAAVLGVSAFYDLGIGDDRYYGGNFSLGAAAGGIATFYDDGGSDYYSGKVYSQGAAGFGIALMLDDSLQSPPNVPTDVETPDPIELPAFDNDTYTAWSESQGFARTKGIAICANRRGNELYHAGGVYLDAPLFTDRYQSFSQGFAIGERDIDYAGGIALLADYGGNDRYLGDVYNQGVGYWYSAGFLYDGGGNDLYEMTQYGQGSGIHLAVGGLIDEAGTDTYIMHNGLGQSGSHDFAASLLLDKAGNDRYLGNTSCNGCGLTNACALFIDREGDDVYAGKRGSLNVGRPARGFGSIGVLLDMKGTDDYLGLMHDDDIWTKDETGMGVDIGELTQQQIVTVAEAKEPGSGLWLEDNTAGMPVALAEKAGVAKNNSGFDKPSEGLKMPDELAYSGELNQEIFDKLWEIAIRWEVGDNRIIVPEARKRLEAFGPGVLPYIEAKMSDPNSLAIRGYVDIFKSFAYEAVPPPPADAPPADPNMPAPVPVPLPTIQQVQELLARQLATGDSQRQMSALSVITELKLPGMGSAVAGLLDSPDGGMQRRAIATLGAIGDPVANERLRGWLSPAAQPDEALIKASVEALCAMKVDCYGQLRELLGYPSITVREALVNQLKAQWSTYKVMVVSDYHNPAGLNLQAQRGLLRVLLAVDEKPTGGMLDDLRQYLDSPDWGVRQDMMELWKKWSGKYYDDPELLPWFTSMTGIDRDISGMLETTTAPLPERIPEPPQP